MTEFTRKTINPIEAVSAPTPQEYGQFENCCAIIFGLPNETWQSIVMTDSGALVQPRRTTYRDAVKDALRAAKKYEQYAKVLKS